VLTQHNHVHTPPPPTWAAAEGRPRGGPHTTNHDTTPFTTPQTSCHLQVGRHSTRMCLTVGGRAPKPSCSCHFPGKLATHGHPLPLPPRAVGTGPRSSPPAQQTMLIQGNALSKALPWQCRASHTTPCCSSHASHLGQPGGAGHRSHTHPPPLLPHTHCPPAMLSSRTQPKLQHGPHPPGAHSRPATAQRAGGTPHG
jgi:hypothetical protein